MRARMMSCAVALSLLLGARGALAAPPEDLARRVESLRVAAGVPGLSLAIVEDGKTSFAKGFGVRGLNHGDPVDAHTIFLIGSTTKAFTAAALALLVDRGRLKWDDRVIDHLPWFRMYDPWVTREITVRDLLVHRSGLGLGQGDLLAIPRSNLSREETVRRIANLKPATSFRSGFAYDNVLYIVAGQLIQAVTGESWERFVADNLLKSGGLADGTPDQETRLAITNRALPHGRLDGGLRGTGRQQELDERDQVGTNAAPAGLLALSAADWARWLAIQLGHGAVPGGGRLWSATQADEMWGPVVPEPIPHYSPALKPTEPMFNAYALGWNVSDYRGVRIISHGGAVIGSQSMAVLIPDRNIGFAISINSEDAWLLRGLMFELLDHYLGQPKQDWPEKWQAYYDARAAEAKAILATAKAVPAGVGPSLPVRRYAGTYRDAWYGDIVIAPRDDGLGIDFRSTPRMTGRLRHYQYDTFVVHFDDPSIEPVYVSFSLDAAGRIDTVRMKAESPIADFSFDYQDLLFRPVAAD